MLVKVAEQPPVKLNVSRKDTTAEAALELAPGNYAYQVSGTANDENGEPLTVGGEGLLVVSSKTMESRYRVLSDELGPFAAAKKILEIVSVGASPIVQRHLQFSGGTPLNEAAISQAKFPLPLPPAYRKALQEIGPFSVSIAGEKRPAVALFAPDNTQTFGTWLGELRALAKTEPTTSVAAYSVEELSYIDEELLARAKLAEFKQWETAPIAAVNWNLPYLLLRNQKCDDGSARAQWLDDFSGMSTDEETGEESYLTWMDYSECEIDVRAKLDEALEGLLQSELAAVGVVFVSPSAESEETGLALERDDRDPDAKKLLMFLNFGSWD